MNKLIGVKNNYSILALLIILETIKPTINHESIEGLNPETIPDT